MERPDRYLTYVNIYYALQEAYERAKGDEGPLSQGLGTFCHRASPFLWDEEASADRTIYEGFTRAFDERFGSRSSSPEDAYDFARSWLASLGEGGLGEALLDAFDSVADRAVFVGSFDAIARQVALRREMIERFPQERPHEAQTPPARVGVVPAGVADVPAVAALVAPDDDAAQDRMRAYLRKQLSSGDLLQWIDFEGGEAVATAGLLPVRLPPSATHEGQTVAQVVLCGGSDEALDALLAFVSVQARHQGITRIDA